MFYGPGKRHLHPVRQRHARLFDTRPRQARTQNGQHGAATAIAMIGERTGIFSKTSHLTTTQPCITTKYLRPCSCSRCLSFRAPAAAKRLISGWRYNCSATEWWSPMPPGILRFTAAICRRCTQTDSGLSRRNANYLAFTGLSAFNAIQPMTIR